jgi:DNA-directed RNA polymerase specialized sigma24 family protein
MSTNLLRSPYQLEEVTGLVETWARLQPHRAKAFFQVRLLDLEVAFSKLSLWERQTVLCMGFADLTSRETAILLGVHFSTAARWYTRALDKLTKHMNGEDPD